MADHNESDNLSLEVSDFDLIITLTPDQETEFGQLQEVYGTPSDEVAAFLTAIIQKQIIILNAIEEKVHARIH